MPRVFLILTAMAAALALGPAASGQNLLEKVENRVEKALDRSPPPPAERAPEDDPPAAAVDDLPPPAPGAADADDAPPAADATQSGYLGVVLEDLPDGGIRVVEIAQGSPAEEAGLKVGDKITAINQAAVTDIEEFGMLMTPVPPGGRLTLTVDRSGEQATIEATLGQPPAAPAPEEGAPIELGPPLGPGAGNLPPVESRPTASGDDQSDRASLGVSVITFSDESRLRSDVPTRSGALITNIRPESAAALAGLPRGGVIVAFDGQRIDTAQELVDAIGASQPGQEVELSYYEGNRLQRKDVTLSAAADSRLLAPGYGGLPGRPLLRGVERAIEGLAGPGGPGAAAAADFGPPRPSADETALRQEIAALKAKVETLESRLADLEAKLAPGAAVPPEGPPPAADNPVEPANPADNAPPTLRPRTPRNPAGAKIGDE